MKRLFETIVISASSVMILLSLYSCNNGLKPQNEVNHQTITAAPPPTYQMNPCVWQKSPLSCKNCAAGNTTQCYIDLDSQHKIPDGSVQSYLDRIVGSSFNFTPEMVQNSINGIQCDYKFVMEMKNIPGKRYMHLYCINTSFVNSDARVFPVALIQHVIPANLTTVERFEFYWLSTPNTCQNHESVLMVIKYIQPKYDYYDISVPPDFNLNKENSNAILKHKLTLVLSDTIQATNHGIKN